MQIFVRIAPLLFFFLMIRRPPRSTLFPYNDALPISGARQRDRGRSAGWLLELLCRFVRPRSEEHTSELQSHVNLVCRLLLEKKKNKRERRQLENNEVVTACQAV